MGKEAGRPRVQGASLPSPQLLSFKKRLETQHARSIQHYRGIAIGRKMRTERKTGTSELLFPLRGKKIWGERKGQRNPYTIVLHYWMRENLKSRERRGKEKLRK